MTRLLNVENLSLQFQTDAAPVQALREVSLAAHQGEVVGIVGESGCGKSTLVTALIGLLAQNAQVTSGAVQINGTDILALPKSGKRALRGAEIAVVFQDPMTAFNPVIPLGQQLVDFQHHRPAPRAEKRARAQAMLARVGLADASRAMSAFPHELSGGMRQRAAIASRLVDDALNSWSRMNQPRRLMSRWRRRSSICCANCAMIIRARSSS